MHPHRRRQNPMRQNLPAQAPSTREPFAPSQQADAEQFPPLQKQHESGYGGQPPVYVISTFDARPINAVDFQTRSGNHPDDIGFLPIDDLDPLANYALAECNYTVQPGRVGVLKAIHIAIVPAQGELFDEGHPIFAPNGASNFRCVYTILVDGVPQEGFAGIVTWDGAFGDIFADCYVLAQEGQTITLRVQTTQNESMFFQALMILSGTLLQATGKAVNFEPATDAAIPVYSKTTRRVSEAG